MAKVKSSVLSLLLMSGLLQGLVQLALIAPVWAASPVAILKSGRNGSTYQEQHIGTFEDDYKVFRKALDGANVRYDELSDTDVDAGVARLSGYKVIVVPLLVDLPAAEVSALSDFARGGGKLLITDGAGVPGAGAQSLEALAGVASAKQATIKEVNKLVWSKAGAVNPPTAEFAIASVISQLALSGTGSSMATWQDASGQEQGIGIARAGNVIFMGWAPGVQGEVSSNALMLSQALDELSPGITQAAAVQISFADYQTISQELDYLAKRTDEAIKTAKQAEFSVPLKTIQAAYDAAVEHVKSFQQAYSDRRFLEADEHVQKARQDFAMAFAQSMPVRPVEARSVWLDRGTIVSTRGAKGMAQLFRCV